VDGVGHFSPRLSLLFVVDSRYAVPALRFLTYPGPFADSQPSAGTLSVIFDHELIRNVTRVFGSRAGEGSHDDTISYTQVPELIRGQKSVAGLVGHVHFVGQRRGSLLDDTSKPIDDGVSGSAE